MHLYLLVKLVFHELLSCFLVLIQTSFATERYESITALFRMVEHICQMVYLPIVEHFLQCFFAMVAFQNSLFHTLHLFKGLYVHLSHSLSCGVLLSLAAHLRLHFRREVLFCDICHAAVVIGLPAAIYAEIVFR